MLNIIHEAGDTNMYTLQLLEELALTLNYTYSFKNILDCLFIYMYSCDMNFTANNNTLSQYYVCNICGISLQWSGICSLNYLTKQQCGSECLPKQLAVRLVRLTYNPVFDHSYRQTSCLWFTLISTNSLGKC